MSEVTALKVNDGGFADLSYHDQAKVLVQTHAGTACGVQATNVIMKNPNININLSSQASGSNKDHQHTGATNRGHYQVLSQRNSDDEQELPIPQREVTGVQARKGGCAHVSYHDDAKVIIRGQPGQDTSHPEHFWTCVCKKLTGFLRDKRCKTAGAVVLFLIFCGLAIMCIYRLMKATECEMLDEIANGSINCTMSDTPYNTSVGTNCSIECDERYRLYGPEEVTCQRTGEWSVTEPVKCALRACDSPRNIEFGNVQCSNNTHKVGTTCAITCSQDHVLFAHGNYYEKDNYDIECLPNEKWSEENLPRCVCPPCKTGDNCQWTTSWEVVKNNIMKFGGSSELNYAGHEISTELDTIFPHFTLRYLCVCKDTKTDASAKCRGKSRHGACAHACSKVILDLVSRGEYENPCNRSSMYQEVDCNHP